MRARHEQAAVSRELLPEWGQESTPTTGPALLQQGERQGQQLVTTGGAGGARYVPVGLSRAVEVRGVRRPPAKGLTGEGKLEGQGGIT